MEYVDSEKPDYIINYAAQGGGSVVEKFMEIF